VDLAELPSSDFVRHPWEVVRGNFFRRILADGGVFERPRRVLDAGAGDGFFVGELLERLPAGSAAVAWDTGYDEASRTGFAPRATPGLRFTRDEPDEQFDLVMMLDVLEHIDDDAAFLERRVRRNVEPDGLVLLSVPCWPALFTSHDVALGHFRRYRPRAFLASLAGAGLRVVGSGGLFSSLTVPRAMAKMAESLFPRRRNDVPGRLEWRGGALSARLVEGALELDASVGRACARRGLGLPGLSFWALCRREASQTLARETR
jgi:SAM-dependent methyltransferase